MVDKQGIGVLKFGWRLCGDGFIFSAQISILSSLLSRMIYYIFLTFGYIFGSSQPANRPHLRYRRDICYSLFSLSSIKD